MTGTARRTVAPDRVVWGVRVAEPRVEPVDQTLLARVTVTFELDG